jgi:hypothetical protein
VNSFSYMTSRVSLNRRVACVSFRNHSIHRNIEEAKRAPRGCHMARDKIWKIEFIWNPFEMRISESLSDYWRLWCTEREGIVFCLI